MSSTHIVPGLFNLGNTCFLNSVLQSLASLKNFVRFLTDMQKPSTPASFSSTLLQCLNGLKDGRTGYNTAQAVYDGLVKRAPQFKGSDQQDAQEVCHAVLNLVDADRASLKGFKPVHISKLQSRDDFMKRRYSPQLSGIQEYSTPISFESSIFSAGSGLEQLLNVPAILPSYFSKLPMQGTICSTLRCSVCNTSKAPSIASFNDISLPLPESLLSYGGPPLQRFKIAGGSIPCADVPFPWTHQDGSIDLHDCLTAFSREEFVDNVECEFCTDVRHASRMLYKPIHNPNSVSFSLKHGPALQRFSKRLTLARLPSVLCLHLCRRYYNATHDRIMKLSQRVYFPFKLTSDDLSCCCSDQAKSSTCQYSLCAVIVHHGSADAGHYIAYRKISGDRWVYTSDTSVRAASADEVRNCEAYMLFYEMGKLTENNNQSSNNALGASNSLRSNGHI